MYGDILYRMYTSFYRKETPVWSVLAVFMCIVSLCNVQYASILSMLCKVRTSNQNHDYVNNGIGKSKYFLIMTATYDQQVIKDNMTKYPQFQGSSRPIARFSRFDSNIRRSYGCFSGSETNCRRIN